MINKICIVSTPQDKNIQSVINYLLCSSSSNFNVEVLNSPQNLNHFIFQKNCYYYIRKIRSFNPDNLKEIEELTSLFSYLSMKGLAIVNKMKVIPRQQILFKAEQLGISVPKNMITSLKSEVILFRKEVDCIVIKSIGDVIISKDYNLNFKANYVRELTLSQLKDFPDTFFPVYIEEKIVKKFEIRSFVVNKVFYSMAILSGSNEIDIRLVRRNSSTSYHPYLLPIEIQKKILSLLKYLKISSASIDIIYSHCNNYYLLDVNPGGQYTDIEYYCNANISKSYIIDLYEEFYQKNKE